MTLRPSKIELPPRRQLAFLKINVFGPKMVLRTYWECLGPLLGALGGLLGGSWALLGCSWGSLGGFSGAKGPSWVPLRCSCCSSSRLFSFDLLPSRCFSSLGASCGRSWVSKMTLRLAKTLNSFRRGLDFAAPRFPARACKNDDEPSILQVSRTSDGVPSARRLPRSDWDKK